MITWILVIILVGIMTLMLDYYIYQHKAANKLRKMQDEINKKSSKAHGYAYFSPTPAAR